MKVSLNRKEQTEVKTIHFQVGETMYLLTESNDGGLIIKKHTLSEDKPYITQSIIIPREYRCTIYNCDNIYKGKNYNDICGECNDKFTRLDLSRKEIWQAKRKPRTLNN